MTMVSVWCSDGARVTPEEVQQSLLFQSWLKRALAEGFDVKSAHVVEGYKWGEPKEIRLLLLEVDMWYRGRKLDPQVYLCTDVVSAVATVICDGRRYGVLTHQARGASPQGKVLDWPCGTIEAGDVDESGKINLDVAGLREAYEETGTEGLVDWHVQPNPQYDLLQSDELLAVSEGRTSEGVGYVWLEAKVTPEVLKKLQGREAGLHEENEHTTVVVAPWSDVPIVLGEHGRPCGKALLGWTMVELMMRRPGL